MTSHDDWPPEPPDDGYDQPPPTRLPLADKRAEEAVLAVLTTTPDAAPRLAGHLVADDFYWPHHQTIWTTWHTLHDTLDTPPDAVLLNAELLKTKQPDVARTLLDLITNPAGDHLAEHYARVVRDHARLRVVRDLAAGLDQLAEKQRVDQIDYYLGEALQRLDDTVTRYGPTPGDQHSRTGLTDLSWILTTGQAPRQPAPVYVERTDGTALFYAGQVNGVFGDPEHGKTWLAQLAIVQALNNGDTASMIDCDHNGPDASAARLLLLGARPEHLADPQRFRYYEPQEGEQLLAAVTEVTARADHVVLIDSIGEVFGLLGVNPNDEIETTKAMRATCTRPAMAGSCVIIVDHLPKGQEARASGFAIGSIAKKRMIRGSYIRAEAKQKPAPGQIGRITLRIEKDTMGELRRSSGGGYAGTLTLDSTRDYALTWDINRDTVPTNEDGTKRYTTYMEKVATFVDRNPGCSGRDITSEIPGKDRTIRDALATLVHEGHIRREPAARGAFLHYLEIPYREAEDDRA